MTSAVNNALNSDDQVITMSAEEARRTWRSLLDVVITGEDVVVERYARPTVAVISYEDYAAIRHELEEMRAIRRTKQMRTAWQQGKLKALPWEMPTDGSTDAIVEAGEHAEAAQ